MKQSKLSMHQSSRPNLGDNQETFDVLGLCDLNAPLYRFNILKLSKAFHTETPWRVSDKTNMWPLSLTLSEQSVTTGPQQATPPPPPPILYPLPPTPPPTPYPTATPTPVPSHPDIPAQRIKLMFHSAGVRANEGGLWSVVVTGRSEGDEG